MNPDMKLTIYRIADSILDIPTLDLPESGEPKRYDLSVADIRDALTCAYQCGADHARPVPPTTQSKEQPQ